MILFDSPEDYHARINDPTLAIDRNTLLVIRGCGTLGLPGSGDMVRIDWKNRRVDALVSEQQWERSLVHRMVIRRAASPTKRP